MSETIQEMENRWTLLMAATDPKTGQRIYERDPKYARDVTALRVQIEQRKQSEAARPQISSRQIEQLEWLDRAQGATDRSGSRLAQEMSQRGNKFRKDMHEARTRVLEGQDISATIAETERSLAESGGTISTPAERPKPARDHLGNLTGDAVLMPRMSQTPTLPQAINTGRGRVA